MNPADTVTHPPSIPRGLDPSHVPHVMTRAEVEAIVDSRLQAYDSDQRRVAAERHVADVRQRMTTYGVSGVAGLAAGIGITLLVQRMRKGRNSGSMKP